jgi:hypothetical protein
MLRALRDIRWSPRARQLGLVAAALLLATWAWWPMIAAWPHTPEHDGRFVLHQWEVGKAAIRQYGEMPLFNPFDCRGIPMWDHPESMTASPLLLASTWLPGTITVWVWNIAHAAAGFVGMWLLGRREVGLDRASSLVAASMWALGVCQAAQFAGAHSTLVCFWLFPLLLLLHRRAERSAGAAVGLGLAVALMLFEGATYPLPLCLVVLAIETATRLGSLRRAARVLRAAVLSGAVAAGVSACRLLPLADQLRSHQRVRLVDADYVLSPDHLLKMFTWREGIWSARLEGQQYVWDEYAAYVGWALLAFALVGFVVCLVEKRWLALLGVAVLLLMLGHFSDVAPWHLLHEHVFPFKSMRVPTRFRHVFHAFLSVWAAVAVMRVPELAARWLGRPRAAPWLRAALAAAALLGVANAAGYAKQIIALRHRGAPAQPVARSPRFFYEGPALAEFIDQPRQNRAWLGCRSYEWPSRRDAPLWTGDVPPVRAADDAATVLGASRTHNTFAFEVDARRPARVLLDSAYERGFRTDVGTAVEAGSLLAVDVPPGRHRVRVRYWPPYMTLGLLVSGVSAAIVAGWALGLGGRLRRRAIALARRT